MKTVSSVTLAAVLQAAPTLGVTLELISRSTGVSVGVLRPGVGDDKPVDARVYIAPHRLGEVRVLEGALEALTPDGEALVELFGAAS